MDGAAAGVLMSDQPVRVGRATGMATIVLPDEPPEVVLDLASAYGARWLAIVGERGRYPAAFLDADGGRCLAEPPIPIGDEPGRAWLFHLAEACAPG